MVQIFYSIFINNKGHDEMIHAENMQYATKENAQKDLSNLYEDLIKQLNIKIVEYNDTILRFITRGIKEWEFDETHTFQIVENKT
jgi:hypothetical protein